MVSPSFAIAGAWFADSVRALGVRANEKRQTKLIAEFGLPRRSA